MRCKPGAALVGQCQGEQLVDQVARARLARGDLRQLFAPHGRRLLREAVVGQGADAGQRRAQFVRHVAREFALRTHAVAQAFEQRVERLAQALEFTRAARHRHRRQVMRIAAVQRLAQLAERAQLALDAAPQPDGQQRQQHALRRQRIEQQPLDQRAACARGLRDHDAECLGRVVVQHHRAQRLAPVVHIGKAMPRALLRRRCLQSPGGRRGASRRARSTAKYTVSDWSKSTLVTSRGDSCNWMSRSPALHVGRHRIGIVEQGAVEGLLGEVAGHRYRHCGPHQPGQGQRQQHAPQHARSERRARPPDARRGAGFTRPLPAGSRCRAACGSPRRCPRASCAGAR
jgi:hypothetical protein